MKTKELNLKVYPYIMDAITTEGYNIVCNTDKDKLQFLYNTFISEYWYDYNKKYYKGNIQKCFESWLMGLPSCFNIDFEDRKDFLCQNWFNFITVKTFQLFKKYKIDMIN